ncbi:unnamed protein product [Tuber melanosporum]|uniref:(Perigord truffle) hypothetical protein n=1 Tax=Tuber melanosporum (strain Mel28) TaxID=656061 RepID=D5GP00_TUBMM|nr:uncharacterized protein GSTUM_00011603001 [Tuber melanosporum]CAZ86243.1 unnamed protein product [Tuber melanosporum]
MVSALLFNRNPACWGCGQKPPSLAGARRAPNGGVLYFVCPSCGNPNHFDERGEIRDFVPSTPEGQAPRFARKRHSPTSKVAHETPPASPIFCRNCLNNQKIVSTRIGDYELPPDSHPDLDYHINVLFPRFQKELEERFPLVCADCAPRANEQIRSKNYKVKVESLRQMLAKSGDPSRTREEKANSWGLFERLVWVLRGGVWCYSHFIVAAWAGMAMLFPDRAAGTVLADGEGTWVSCISHSLEGSRFVPDCYEVASRQALKFLPWSIFGFFWVYWESSLQKYPEKKLVGANEYLWMEIGVWAFRMTCWAAFAYSKLTFSEDVMLRVYLGIFFFSIMVGSLSCLKLENPPSFSLREPMPISATPSPPSSPPQEVMKSSCQPRPPSYQSIQASPTTPRLPFKKLVPPTTGASTVYSPQTDFRSTFTMRDRSVSPSPSPSLNKKKGSWSPDAMDWNPTDRKDALWEKPIPQPSFAPSFNQQSSQSRPQEQQYRSPFTGTLPPAPKPPSHKYVNSLMHPVPAKPIRSQPEKEQFFLPRQTGLSPEFAKLSDPTSAPGSSYPPLANQKLFMEDEQTGLEGLFGPGLKLDDEPDIPIHPRPYLGWAGVLWRVGLLVACLVVVTKLQDTTNVPTVASLISAGCIAQRSGADWGLGQTVLACAGVLLSIAAVLLPSDQLLKRALLAFVVLALSSEFWGVLVLLQKERARKFYACERRKKLEVEERIRRGRRGLNSFASMSL